MSSERPHDARRPSRLPSLDGARAALLLLVMTSHLRGTRGVGDAHLIRVLNIGDFALRGFFVLSGFLITTLLLRETAGTGTISLRAFYARRAMRILPAATTYVLVMAALAAAGAIALYPGDLLAAATYTMNYHWDRAWWLGHLWSLSVEEQFYLLWPAALLLVGVRRGLRCAAALMLLAPLGRVAIYYLLPAQRAGLDESFPTVCDSIATGCLLAGARAWLAERPGHAAGYLAFLRSPWFAVVPAAAFGANLTWAHPKIFLLGGETVANVGLALCLDWCVRHPAGAVGRTLNARPVVWLGTISYSVYLWQQPFLNRTAGAWWNAFPLDVVLAIGVGAASHYLIERPFLRRREQRPRVAAEHGGERLVGQPQLAQRE